MTALGVASCILVGCSAVDSPERIGQTSAEVTWEECAVFGNNNPTNDEITFNYFVGKGLSGEQAAAIVGTFDGEDGNNPQSNSGTNRGIAQWQAGGRWDTDGVDAQDNLLSYAASTGRAGQEYTLQVQLDFVWFELSTYPVFGLAELKATTTVAAATSTFIEYYEMAGGEGPDGPHVCWAEFAFQTYGGGSGSGGSGAGGNSGAGAGTPPQGSSGDTRSDSGCSVGPPRSSGRAGWAWLAGLAIAIGLRTRRSDR